MRKVHIAIPLKLNRAFRFLFIIAFFLETRQFARAKKAGFLDIQAANLIIPVVQSLLDQIPSAAQTQKESDLFSSLQQITKAGITFATTQVYEDTLWGSLALKDELAHIRAELTNLSSTPSLSETLQKFQQERNCAKRLILQQADLSNKDSILSYFNNENASGSPSDSIVRNERAKVFQKLQILFRKTPDKVDDMLYFIVQPQHRQQAIEFLKQAESEVNNLYQSLVPAFQKPWKQERVDVQKEKNKLEKQLAALLPKYKSIVSQLQFSVLLPEIQDRLLQEEQALSQEKARLEGMVRFYQESIAAIDKKLKRLTAPSSWCKDHL